MDPESNELLSQRILDVSPSVEDLKKTTERDVVLHATASSSSRAHGTEAGVVLGSGKSWSSFDVQPSSASSWISTRRHVGSKVLENSRSFSDDGRPKGCPPSRYGSLYEDVSSSTVKGTIW